MGFSTRIEYDTHDVLKTLMFAIPKLASYFTLKSIKFRIKNKVFCCFEYSSWKFRCTREWGKRKKLVCFRFPDRPLLKPPNQNFFRDFWLKIVYFHFCRIWKKFYSKNACTSSPFQISGIQKFCFEIALCLHASRYQ